MRLGFSVHITVIKVIFIATTTAIVMTKVLTVVALAIAIGMIINNSYHCYSCYCYYYCFSSIVAIALQFPFASAQYSLVSLKPSQFRPFGLSQDEFQQSHNP